MLVDEMLFPMLMKIVLRPITIWYLNMTSKSIPAISVIEPKTIDIFRYFLELNSYLVKSWLNIKKKPIIAKNMMSLPLDDPIKNKCVIGCITGFNTFVMKSMPPIIINRIPTNIVLFIFIKNNYLN